MWMMKCLKCNKYIGNPDRHSEKCLPDQNNITTFVQKKEAQEFIEKKQLNAAVVNVLFQVYQKMFYKTPDVVIQCEF